jgi:hypothetical protein
MVRNTWQSNSRYYMLHRVCFLFKLEARTDVPLPSACRMDYFFHRLEYESVPNDTVTFLSGGLVLSVIRDDSRPKQETKPASPRTHSKESCLPNQRQHRTAKRH